MNLSDDLFEQITTALAASEAGCESAIPNASGEQRGSRRVNAGAEQRATLIPLTDSIASAPVGVTLRDVSPGGVGFVHSGRVALDDEFVLILPTSQGNVSILCGVAYWQPVAAGTVAVGAKFNRVLRQGLAPTRPSPIDIPVRKAV